MQSRNAIEQTEQADVVSDSDATMICPDASQKQQGIRLQKDGTEPHGIHLHADDDFVINNYADNCFHGGSYHGTGSSGEIKYHSPSPGGSSFGSKYDLTKRVMRAVSKPTQPDSPDVVEYGIHRIVREHQKGGMGRILVAYDQYLKRDVAIKELHAEVAEDEMVVRRFIGEAEITAQLEHPGVVPIHRLCQGSNGLPYYTMKMIKGETLQDAIKSYHQNPDKKGLQNLVRRLVSVSRTIAFAHDKGIIHRDLKPANVMLGEYGETLVMDWGLAKPYLTTSEDQIAAEPASEQPGEEIDQKPHHNADDSSLGLTTVGSIIGTPSFMSPEQANAEENLVGPVSDVFSLGAMLYYLLAGRTAFYGRSTQEVLDEVRECKVIPPSQVKPNVPHSLEAVCLKAMAKLPADRYQTATNFATDLCRWLDNEPVSAEKHALLARTRRYVRHHQIVTVVAPCVLILSLLFAGIGTLLLDWTRAVSNPSANIAAVLGKQSFIFKDVQIEEMPGISVWQDVRQSGELMLVCKVEPAESVRRVVSIHPPGDGHWNLSNRDCLTVSLLAIPLREGALLSNFAIRLGCGDTYREYRPIYKSWSDRCNVRQHFVIPLNWHFVDFGLASLSKIEWIQIHFDADAELLLHLDLGL